MQGNSERLFRRMLKRLALILPATILFKWKKWQTEPQTDREYNNLSWRKNGKEANGFGVLLGTKAKNGMYLSVIDYDVKGNIVTEEAKQKGKELLKELVALEENK